MEVTNVFTELLQLLYEMGQEVVKQGTELIKWLQNDLIINGQNFGEAWAVIVTLLFAVVIPYTIIKWLSPV